MNPYAKEIRRIRHERKLSLVDVAEKSGISVPYLSAIERGKRNPPKPEIVVMIAKGLDVPERQGDHCQLAEHSTEAATLDKSVLKNVAPKHQHLVLQMARRTDNTFWEGLEELLNVKPDE